MQIELRSEKIFIANKAIDLRKAVNGLIISIIEDMELKPNEGLYIFYNKDKNRIKIIGWHKNGYMLIYKRLEQGKFFVQSESGNLQINAEQLNWLLSGVDWRLLGDAECKFSAYF